jgi:hypothetical protein
MTDDKAAELLGELVRQRLEEIERVKVERPDVVRELSLPELLDILGATIKRDDVNKIIHFLAMLLAYTDDAQITVTNRGPSSAGKSYIPLEIKELFPPEDIITVGYCSPTAFFHETGAWDDVRKEIVVRLERKILIFLDQPHDELLRRLRPLLSHDQKDMLIKITDRREKKGMRTKNVRLVGYPTVIFCTGSLRMDEQEATRAIVLSPETTAEKIREALYLKALRKGDPDAFARLLEADERRRLLKERIRLIKQARIRKIIVPDPIEIARRFEAEYPRLKPRHARDIERVISLAQGLALLNLWSQRIDEQLNLHMDKKYIDMAFDLYRSIAQAQEMGVAPFVMRIYTEVVEPLIKRSEAGFVSARDILRAYHATHGYPLSVHSLEREILPSLEAAGLLVKDVDPQDKRKVVYSLPGGHRRPGAAVAPFFKTMERMTLKTFVLSLLLKRPMAQSKLLETTRAIGLPDEAVIRAVDELFEEGRIVKISSPFEGVYLSAQAGGEEYEG